MKYSKFVFLLILLFFVVGSASATDYYVNTTGDDGLTGTSPETAWETITYAGIQAINPGDIVHIKGGDYGHENVDIQGTGSSDNYIVFESYDGEAVLVGDDTGRGIQITSESYIRVTGFNVSNYDDEIYVYYSDHVIINDTVVHNGGSGNGIRYDHSTYGIVDNVTAYLNHRGVLFIYDSNYSIIRNCTAYNNDMHSFSIWGSDYCTIEDSFAYSVTSLGEVADYHFYVGYDSNHNNITDCVGGIYKKDGGAESNHGFVSRQYSDYNNFTNCTSYCTNTEHFKVGEDGEYNVFDNCSAVDYFYDSDVTGFYLKSNNNTIKNSIAQNCTNGVRLVWTVAESHLYPVEGNIIENCVFVNNSQGIDFDDAGTIPADNNTVKNCIIYDNGDGIYHDSGVTNSVLEYNNVYGNTDNYNDCSPGTGSISVDPLFTDYSGNDFHLQSVYGRWTGSIWTTDVVTSPCIDAGDPEYDYSNEPAGNGGRINIGMYGNTVEASVSSSSGLEAYDNRLKSNYPNTVYQTNTYLDVGNSTTYGQYRIWTYFNTSSYDPTDIVESVEYMGKWYDSIADRDGATKIEIFIPNGTVDKDYLNWINRSNGNAWNNAGGDWLDVDNTSQGSIAFASVVIPNVTATNEFYSFNSTNFTHLVQSWINGTRTNNGFFLIGNETGNNRVDFYSLDSTTPAFRPTLPITIQGDTYTSIGVGGAEWDGNSTGDHTTVDLGDGHVKVGIMRDNFNDNDYSGWQVLAGTWTASGGSLHMSNADIPQLISYNASVLENLQVSMNFTETNSDDANGNLGVTFVKDGDNYYICGIGDAAANEDDVHLRNRIDGEWGDDIYFADDVFSNTGPNDLYIVGFRNSTNYTSVEVYYSNMTLIDSGGGVNNSHVINSIGIRGWPSATGDEISFDNFSAYNINQTTGNRTTWYDTGTGNETYEIVVNASTPTNNNYTVWYRENNTGVYSQVGGVRTGNDTISLSPSYQNTDVRLVLNGTDVEIMTITFYEQGTSDSTPPASITNLLNETGANYHNWTWTNPLDVDFNHSYVFVNEVFTINTSDEYYSLSTVAHNTSNISIRTVDTTGNINTTWVNHTSTISNKLPILFNVSTSYSLNETEILSIDANYTEADGDSIEFADNSTDWNIDSNTGIVSWVTTNGDNGTYYCYINVTDDYGGVDTKEFTVTVNDTTLPTYTTASHNTTIAGDSILFSIQYNDTTALHDNGQWIFSTNNTGSWVNESAVNWTATPEYANHSTTLNSTHDVVVGYRWYANDSAGNSNNTGIYTLTVQDIIAPEIILLSYPSPLYQNTTGYFNMSWGISHNNTGINNTTVAMIYTLYDVFNDNYNNSIRYPSNNRSALCTLLGEYILRADNRNNSLNFEDNNTITEGNIYKWGGADENTSRLTIVPHNSTYTYVYWNGTAQDTLWPGSWYLDRTDQTSAIMTGHEINKFNGVLLQGIVPGCGAGLQNQLIDMYIDSYDGGADPTKPINIIYLNDSYNPLGAINPLDSSYAFLVTSMNASEWFTDDYITQNASYTNSITVNTTAILAEGITPTTKFYVYLITDEAASKSYWLNKTNVATSTNVSFADTGVMWVGIGAPFTTHSYTPNVFFISRSNESQFKTNLYVADNNGLWNNSGIQTLNIAVSNYTPSTPSIDHFHVFGADDYDMNGTYAGIIDVGCGVSNDPDGGIVTHNLTIWETDQTTYVGTINNTFTNSDITHGVFADIEFDTRAYTYGDYTLKLVATDDESETSEVWLGVNFTILNNYPVPNPTNLAYTTGNFYVNYTFDTGSGNTTDSFNISYNGTWDNTSSDMFRNESVGAHEYLDIIVYAYNSSGTGSLSTGYLSDNVTVPNNAISISNISASYSINEGETLYIDAEYSDVDGDTPTFADNSSKWAVNSATGVVSWVTINGDDGVYYWKINVSDGYGSTDPRAFTVTVNDSSVDIPILDTWTNSISGIDLYPKVESSSSVTFSVTSTETINTWSWYVGGVSQSNNYDNLTTSWSATGQKTVYVYGTNAVGDSNTITWYPYIRMKMAGASHVVSKMDETGYDDIIDGIGGDTPDFEQILWGASEPYQAVAGNMFFVVLFGLPMIMMWIRQGSLLIPSVFGILIGTMLLSFFPASFAATASAIIILSVLATFYTFYKERR